MKKITLITSAVLALFALSCQKENVAPSQSGYEAGLTSLGNHIFKFKKEVTVYDKTNEHSVAVELQSDNENTVNNAFKLYKNMEMVLIYEQPFTSNIKNKALTTNQNVKFSPNPLLNNLDILIIKLNNVNKGNSKGYTFIQKENSRETTVNYHTHTVSYYYVWAFGFRVAPTSGYLTNEYNSYYDESDSSWHLQNSHGTLNVGQAWTSSDLTPYMYRLLELRTNAEPFGCWANVTFYD